MSDKKKKVAGADAKKKAGKVPQKPARNEKKEAVAPHKEEAAQNVTAEKKQEPTVSKVTTEKKTVTVESHVTETPAEPVVIEHHNTEVVTETKTVTVEHHVSEAPAEQKTVVEHHAPEVVTETKTVAVEHHTPEPVIETKTVTVETQETTTFQSPFAHCRVGGTVQFGRYPQKPTGSDPAWVLQPIEWLVLDKRTLQSSWVGGVSEEVLLISKYALDCKPFAENGNEASWESSLLRHWLNNEFFLRAFEINDQKYVSRSPIVADARDLNNDQALHDKVFALTIAEAHRYFTDKNALRCAATPFAIDHGVRVKPEDNSAYWWLRMPDPTKAGAAMINQSGMAFEVSGKILSHGMYAVRPVIWGRVNV